MRYFILFSLFTLLACGESKDSTGDTATSSIAAEPTSEVVSEVTPSTPACLNDCNPIEEFRFDFGPDISLALVDCKVLDYKVFPLADSYQLIIKADCLQGVQAYAVSFDKAGKLLSSPSVLSSPCSSFFKDLEGFAATSLGGEIAFVYTCLNSGSTLAQTWFSKIGGTPNLIETSPLSYMTGDYDLKIAWNADANILAVASKRGLLRLNAQGVKLGGTVNLNLSKPIQSLTSVSGQWFVISRDANAYLGTKSYCSKVLSNGQIACDRRELGGPWTQIASKSLVVQGLINYTSNVSLAIAAFNPETCALGPNQDMGFQIQKNFVLESGGHLKPGFGWALSSSKDGTHKRLTLNIYETHLAGKIQSTLAVADGEITHAQAYPEGDGLSIFYLDELGNLHLRKGSL